jgi:hypothetical protein
LPGRRSVMPRVRRNDPPKRGQRRIERVVRAGDQRIPEPLMIPFEMVVLDNNMHGSTKMTLPQRNDPVETFFLIDRTNRSPYAFAFGGLIRRLDDPDSGVAQASRTGPRHFESRSQMSTRHVSASAIVSVRPT